MACKCFIRLGSLPLKSIGSFLETVLVASRLHAASRERNDAASLKQSWTSIQENLIFSLEGNSIGATAVALVSRKEVESHLTCQVRG